MQPDQAAGVAGQVAGFEGDFGLHPQDRLFADRVEQLGLASEVVVDPRLVRLGRLPDPLDAGSGEPVLGELVYRDSRPPS